MLALLLTRRKEKSLSCLNLISQASQIVTVNMKYLNGILLKVVIFLIHVLSKSSIKNMNVPLQTTALFFMTSQRRYIDVKLPTMLCYNTKQTQFKPPYNNNLKQRYLMIKSELLLTLMRWSCVGSSPVALWDCLWVNVEKGSLIAVIEFAVTC